MTFPFRDEPTDTTNRLKRLLDIAWLEADRGREQSTPGSKIEADYLAQQHAIEQLQQVLS